VNGRRDVVIRVGPAGRRPPVVVVSGDRARELLVACGVALTATYQGWECPLFAVPRLFAYCEAHGWQMTERVREREDRPA
jgi:hypothetical protein